MNNSYLCHYGILGQKWGVRRYQNDDGSLTEAGKKRYLKRNGRFTRAGRKVLNAEYDKIREFDEANHKWYEQRISSNLKAHGYTDVNKKDAVIKKGSVVTRVAGDEGIDNTRKYAAITDFDTWDYEAHAHELPIKGDKAYSYTYELTKDAKVANYNNVMGHLMNTYGKVKLKDLGYGPNDFRAFGGSTQERLLKQINDTYGNLRVKDLYADSNKLLSIRSNGRGSSPQWLTDRGEIAWHAIQRALNKSIFDKQINNDIFDHYKKRGYDAIVDVEDKYINYQMPLIFLDPSKTFKLKNKRRIEL